MSLLKILYYASGTTIGGYFVMKLVERDPESLRKVLPERHEVDYENESKKRTQAFMHVLKSAAAGEEPEAVAKRLRTQMEKAAKTTSTPTS